MTQFYQFYPGKRTSIFSSLSITLILIIINVLFFLGFLVSLIFVGGSEEAVRSVYNYIALKPLNVLQGKYLWTFITSMFMHGGLFHLFANMLSLFFVGSLVERIIGRKRYLWFYLSSGLFAGLFFVLTSLAFSFDMNAFAVGASGALFGVIGLLMLLTPDLPVYVMFIPIPIKMKYAAPGILVVLWFISIAADIPIGNTAHLGGLIAGLGYGFYLKSKYKKKTRHIRRMFR